MRPVTAGSVMNARTRRASPQRGHWVTSSPNTLRDSAVQASLRASSSGVGGAAILVTISHADLYARLSVFDTAREHTLFGAGGFVHRWGG